MENKENSAGAKGAVSGEDLEAQLDAMSKELVQGAVKVLAINKAVREKRKKDRSIDLATPEDKLITAAFKMRASTQEKLKDYIYTKQLKDKGTEAKATFTKAIEEALLLLFEAESKKGFNILPRPDEMRFQEKTMSANMKYGKIVSMLQKIEKQPGGLMAYIQEKAPVEDGQ